MKPHDEPHGLCYVDPVTLGTLALGSLLSAGASAGGAAIAGSMAGGGGGATPTPAAAPTPPPTPTAVTQPTMQPTQSPIGGKGGKTSPPTFLGTQTSAPPQQLGQKTLLGQ